MNPISRSEKSPDVRMLAACALMAALTAVCSQLQIPLPMVPINLALFAVHLTGVLLGARWGALAMTAYVLLGFAGVPVFSGFSSGPAVLFGKTGGYIAGYVLCAFLVGRMTGTKSPSFTRLCLAMAAGTAGCYALGTGWFMLLTRMDLPVTLSYCVIPFLPGDLAKIILAALMVLRLRRPAAVLLGGRQ